jgi:hypothetical protein
MNKKMLFNISFACATLSTIIALGTLLLTPLTSEAALISTYKGYSAATIIGLLSFGSFFVGLAYPAESTKGKNGQVKRTA